MNLRTLKSAESMWNSVGARWFLASHLSAADARRTENLEEKGGPVAAFGSRAYHVVAHAPIMFIRWWRSRSRSNRSG